MVELKRAEYWHLVGIRQQCVHWSGKRGRGEDEESRRGQAEEEEELHTEEEEEASCRSAARGEEERSGRHVNQEARSLAPPDG